MKTDPETILAATPQPSDEGPHGQAIRLGGAYARERDAIQAALLELETMGYADRQVREANALATMNILPGHEDMDRAPREVLRLRVSLYLVSCHEHRWN
jgi:hypothetical protein